MLDKMVSIAHVANKKLTLHVFLPCLLPQTLIQMLAPAFHVAS